MILNGGVDSDKCTYIFNILIFMLGLVWCLEKIFCVFFGNVKVGQVFPIEWLTHWHTHIPYQRLWVRSLLFCFQWSFLLMFILRSSTWWLRYLVCCHSNGRPGLLVLHQAVEDICEVNQRILDLLNLLLSSKL